MSEKIKENSNNKNRKKANSNEITIIIIVAAIIICLIVVFGKKFGTKSAPGETSNPGTTVITKTEKTDVNIPKDMTLDKEKNTVAVDFSNPADSDYDRVYTITYEGEEIYKSDKLLPGDSINEITLNKEFDDSLTEITVKIEVRNFNRESGESTGAIITDKKLTIN